MKRLICNIRHEKLVKVREKLFEFYVPGLTIPEVPIISKPTSAFRKQIHTSTRRVPKFPSRMGIRIILENDAVEEVAETIIKIPRTGNLEDGKLFVIPV